MTNTNSNTEQPLNDTGIVVNSLPPAKTPQDVLSLITHIQNTTWTHLPERASGLNSTQTAHLLNFRKNMPPITSLAHIYALSTSATLTDRQIAALLSTRLIKKIRIAGRGKGAEGLVVLEDWINLVQSHASLAQPLKEKYAKMLEENVDSYSIPTKSFTPEEAAQLIATGFMTCTSALTSAHQRETQLYARAGTTASPGSSSLANAWSTGATGTLAATGGALAIHANGGGGRGLGLSSSSSPAFSHKPKNPEAAHDDDHLTFSLPNTGAYLCLLEQATLHLLGLLKKSSPKYKQSTKDLLRERWDGAALIDQNSNEQSKAKRARGEWTRVLPGKTKKWKQFHGMQFQYIFEECLGSGAVECFKTGSVGLGVRVA
jgi:hypothetical protein